MTKVAENVPLYEPWVSSTILVVCPKSICIISSLPNPLPSTVTIVPTVPIEGTMLVIFALAPNTRVYGFCDVTPVAFTTIVMSDCGSVANTAINVPLAVL